MRNIRHFNRFSIFPVLTDKETKTTRRRDRRCASCNDVIAEEQAKLFKGQNIASIHEKSTLSAECQMILRRWCHPVEGEQVTTGL
ncbi:uncharacterized protein LACBIDRAFT_302838 [Laccaria bicolor S238N-H82]|uniref:Predicted protein n=1 Tax=Laccaria bicolor (strain S238N-H82 / ATCC MYA-4686) TaxID=486041 RepID=B0DIE9_LACBS|nr:uncharacterized protein LACBIDRAFT_302838 [Laccaria bicolor S238N-H82]EDR05553.1 predicted protein [Laccaria bicolor S238N-H82]|eukprot:XP_001883657.1 predicted protein [Laccaria bicolor S238N-H82]